MDSKGYYKILGVEKTASVEEIRKKYKTLALKYHPDKQANKSDKEKKDAEAKFKEINEAYQVLSDENKRAQYDRGGFDFGNAGGGYSGSPFDFGSFGDFNFDEFGFNAGTGFNFSDLFGGRNGGYRQQPKVEKGTDIKMTIAITLEEIFNGCSKKIKYQRNVRCPNCHGVGGTNKHTCPECNGTGMARTTVRSPFGFTTSMGPCKKCGGKGYIVDSKCPTCGGTGFRKEETILDVKFKPGMLDGFAVQYPGKGNESSDIKGQTGDCLVYCKHEYDKDRYAIVNNNDVYEKIEIPYYDALLGCEYILEKPDHKKIKVNIPSCIQNGKHLKLANEGIPYGTAVRGDYYLIVIHKIPDKLSWKERNALEALKLDLNKDNNK